MGYVHGKHPDVRPDVEYSVAGLMRDAVAQIRMPDEDLVVQEIGLVAMQVGDLADAGQDMA